MTGSCGFPASSANLGPAFDAVAFALDVHLEVTADAATTRAGDASRPCARSAKAVGSDRSRSGRGSRAVAGSVSRARRGVGGLVAACAQQERIVAASRAPRSCGRRRSSRATPTTWRRRCSAGVVAVAGGRAVRIPLARDLTVVVWTPDRETPTPSAPPAAPRPGAVRGRGVQHRPDRAARRGPGGRATSARCASQPRIACTRTAGSPAPRTPATPSTRRSRPGACAAWLSGSGPSAAALVEPACADEIAAAMPADGRTRAVTIADVGATVTTRDCFRRIEDREIVRIEAHEDRREVRGGHRRGERHRRRARAALRGRRARAGSSSPTCRRDRSRRSPRESGGGLAVQCDVTDEAADPRARRRGRGRGSDRSTSSAPTRGSSSPAAPTRATRSGAGAST